MKEKKFFNKLHTIIAKDELSALMGEELDVPVPEKIRKMIDEAKARFPGKTSDPIIDIIDREQPVPLAECALEGLKEKESGDDPLHDLMEEEEEG